MPPSAVTQALVRAARDLCERVNALSFRPAVDCVYNPLEYAWGGYEAYLRRCGSGPKRVLFLGMNPGPFGMVQTGVPFGEVAAVRTWLQIQAEIKRPAREHARRPILGFSCPRSEVSGQRLWALFAKRFGTPDRFFDEHIVLNYCPLAFLTASGSNLTPDKLPAAKRTALFSACDEHLAAALKVLDPEWVIGIGNFALARAEEVCTGKIGRSGRVIQLGKIPHPSPASPAANRGWAALCESRLLELGVWSKPA